MRLLVGELTFFLDNDNHCRINLHGNMHCLASSKYSYLLPAEGGRQRHGAETRSTHIAPTAYSVFSTEYKFHPGRTSYCRIDIKNLIQRSESYQSTGVLSVGANYHSYLLENEVEMRTKLETEYGLRGRMKKEVSEKSNVRGR
jgi:hypothetical protein